MPYIGPMLSASPPKNFIPFEVTRRLDVTEDLAVFHFRSPEPVSFSPGQYVTLALPDADGKPVKRAYSIVSAPHEPEVELVIELVEHGALTPLLWALRPGDTVWARRKIVGHFLLDAERLRHVMACTVTGIAPFLSMVRAHRAARLAGEAVPDHRFLLLHGASHAVEFGPYRDELADLVKEDWVEAVNTISRPWNDAGWTGETGRVEDVLRLYLDRLGWTGEDTAGYACGNPDMIENVKGMLARARFPQRYIHEEKYFTTTGEAVPLDDPAPEPDVDTPQPEPKRPPMMPPGGIKLKTAPRE